jgi:hypothetical protein
VGIEQISHYGTDQAGSGCRLGWSDKGHWHGSGGAGAQTAKIAGPRGIAAGLGCNVRSSVTVLVQVGPFAIDGQCCRRRTGLATAHVLRYRQGRGQQDQQGQKQFHPRSLAQWRIIVSSQNHCISASNRRLLQ